MPYRYRIDSEHSDHLTHPYLTIVADINKSNIGYISNIRRIKWKNVTGRFTYRSDEKDKYYVLKITDTYCQSYDDISTLQPYDLIQYNFNIAACDGEKYTIIQDIKIV